MTWILTASGKSLDLRFLLQDSIAIEDIAHHLAQVNRFTGACSRPYSVAEHSLFVAEILERNQAAVSPDILLAGLLHDAHEAYTTDLSSPMKDRVGRAWVEAEESVSFAVRRRFALLTVFAGTGGDLVKWADLTALSTERAALLPAAVPVWPVTRSHPALAWDFEATARFTWRDWRDTFLERYAELDFARRNATTGAGAGDAQ